MSSIRRRPNGKWRARYRDEQGKEHAFHRDTKRAAQDELDRITATLRSGSYVDPKAGAVTLASFYAEWVERQVWSEGTVKLSEQVVRLCDFRDVELGKLRRSHAEAWVKRMSAAGLAPTTVKTRMTYVRAVLSGAVRDRVISADPTDGVILPRARRAEHAMSIPGAHEVGRVIDTAEPWLAVYVSLCAFAGLRQGEAAAVRVADIDFLRRELHVNRQVQAGVGGVRIAPPKFGSERIVYLPDDLLTALSAHVQTQGVLGDAGWLFLGKDGMPPGHSAIAWRWKKALERAGVDPIKLHDLRHFYASGLIAAGCDVVTVQRALGHSNATTTLSIYSHLWPSAADRTRAAAADIISATRESAADSLRTADSISNG
jgi:integrase